MKATARAYAIQGLVKYHGLRNPSLRIPYHDSISVCMEGLQTTTTVEADPSLDRDIVRINHSIPGKRELQRVLAVLEPLRRLAGDRGPVRIESRNSLADGKGLGFSAAGFAALGLAASTALNVSLGTERLSEIVRLGAGSASRSLVGGFSIWYANKGGRSYAESLAGKHSISLRTIIVPISSDVKTDSAHADSVRSPFYKARLAYVKKQLLKMRRAVARGNVASIGAIAEEDTLNLHAVTMTGASALILVKPLSLVVIDEVKRLREEEDVPAWFSLDTGPSVFINTTTDSAAKVKTSISRVAKNVLGSSPGGPAELVRKHLF